MSAEVVEMEKWRSMKKGVIEYCWTCGCGSQSFLLIPDGSVVCHECNCILERFNIVDKFA